ncbi:carbohydrate-binding protein [Streptomyces sp. SKN60]|uniref:CBM35 domain-containing protein n=1 Tax=Streptomyces sp. SKN60 TaxID=2855506 RepID=UPI00224740DA|nr:CBM35 domain-containing protein [Streptomyces sp. SKN60]MCX2184230.1 carbohydrate-binding protein [Streptomyces sp. SKN60]
MAAGNDGTNKPEDDDPFGYLYADGQAAGAQPPSGGGYGYPGPAAQPGVPRTSYNQVRTVGERQYGGHQQAQAPFPQQQGYGQQQPGYGQPNPQYAAPETYPGGGTHRPGPAQPAGRGGGGRGPNTKGLLIGAVAVVAVVVAGITAAVIANSGDKTNDAGGTGGSPTGAPTQVSESPSVDPSQSSKPPQALPQQDAATLKLGGSAALARDIPGAKGADGAYVNFNGQGGSASWTVNVPASGEYTLYITYSVPGKDAQTSLTVNSGQRRSLNMSNFAKAAEGDWEKGWTNTYAYVSLNKGENALKISCEAGDQCDAVLDQVLLKAGHVTG